jgi:hypothetical protein
MGTSMVSEKFNPSFVQDRMIERLLHNYDGLNANRADAVRPLTNMVKTTSADRFATTLMRVICNSRYQELDLERPATIIMGVEEMMEILCLKYLPFNIINIDSRLSINLGLVQMSYYLVFSEIGHDYFTRDVRTVGAPLDLFALLDEFRLSMENNQVARADAISIVQALEMMFTRWGSVDNPAQAVDPDMNVRANFPGRPLIPNLPVYDNGDNPDEYYNDHNPVDFSTRASADDQEYYPNRMTAVNDHVYLNMRPWGNPSETHHKLTSTILKLLNHIKDASRRRLGRERGAYSNTIRRLINTFTTYGPQIARTIWSLNEIAGSLTASPCSFFAFSNPADALLNGRERVVIRGSIASL